MGTRPSLLRLDAPVRPYDWGSASAIPDLLGTPATGEPQAEMWFGAHPGAPALVGDARVPLDTELRAHPDLLGERGAALDEGRFPFLMKLLAAGAPLSLQVHPTRDQARAGHAREDALGLSATDARRSYKDANHKPEIIVAITPFRALCGFRTPDAARSDLVALLGDDVPAGGARLLSALAEPDAGVALAGAVRLILGEPEAMREVARRVVDAAAAAPLTPATDTVRRVAQAYDADPGVLVALLLNRVDLAPGEALFLDAGHLHAYLSGLGLEAMASSDNVLRGGLTSKHVDVEGLLEIVRFEPVRPAVVEPTVTAADGVQVASYRPPVREFSVHIIDVDAGARTLHELVGPATMVVTQGSLTVTAGADSVSAERGDALFQASGEPLRVASPTRARLFLTTLGG